MPFEISHYAQASSPIHTFRNAADAIQDDAFFTEVVGGSLGVREPVGVVSAITPWNHALHQVAAELAAGCTVVLEPSELTRYDTFVLAEIAGEAGRQPLRGRRAATAR